MLQPSKSDLDSLVIVHRDMFIGKVSYQKKTWGELSRSKRKKAESLCREWIQATILF